MAQQFARKRSDGAGNVSDDGSSKMVLFCDTIIPELARGGRLREDKPAISFPSFDKITYRAFTILKFKRKLYASVEGLLFKTPVFGRIRDETKEFLKRHSYYSWQSFDLDRSDVIILPVKLKNLFFSDFVFRHSFRAGTFILSHISPRFRYMELRRFSIWNMVSLLILTKAS